MSRPSPMSIFFHPDAVEAEGKDLVGRRSAGQSFLKGYLTHATGAEINAVTENGRAAKTFDKITRDMGCTKPLRVSALQSPQDLSRAGTVFFPTPGYQGFAWHRYRYGLNTASFVGITHTVSTKRIMEGLHAMLADPIAPHDAIICTSHAVKSVVERQFESEIAYYADRFGKADLTLPHLPVIPLGIETADFAPLPGARARMRAAQGATDDAIVVMTMGRISLVEKANPVPLLIALEQVAQSTGSEIHLWLTGWTHREDEMALHEEAARTLCDKVQVRILDGRDPDLRRNLWAGADIFSLPSDSIQETFGLVPVEAMAAGLPVVMPDWDGFRDTVVDGETGFLIPTRMAPPGSGQTYAARFIDKRDIYLQYLTLVQTQVQIDIPAYAAAFERLVMDSDLRKRMGEAAQKHVQTHFDWKAIIPRYQDLADDLAQMRAAGALDTGKSVPFEIDPFALYAGYPSVQLATSDVVTLADPPTDDTHATMDRLCGRDLYSRKVTTPAKLTAICDWLATNGPTTVADLAKNCNQSLTQVGATVLMLAKCDIVRLPTPPLRSPK